MRREEDLILRVMQARDLAIYLADSEEDKTKSALNILVDYLQRIIEDMENAESAADEKAVRQ